MEFNKKLQEMRKQRGITQEELAEALYVSRTAVSKWESGRGYPSIESLKAIARFFGVTVDELLSGDELLDLAEEASKEKQTHFIDLVFGLLDVSVLMLFFLPFLADRTDGGIRGVSLLAFTCVSPYLKIIYFLLLIGLVAFGVLTLALQNHQSPFWVNNKGKLSLFLNALCAIVFVISLQPYAATYLLIFLILKATVLLKKQ